MRKRSLTPIFAVALSAAAVLVLAPAATAGDTTCLGTLPAGEYDNVIVPSGSNCVITGVTIKGNLKVEPQAGVVDIRLSNIGGSVQGEKFSSLDLHQSTVDGSVQLKAFSTNVQLCNNDVGGDIQVEEGSGRVLVGGSGCAPVGGSNRVGGNIQVSKNVITDLAFGMDVDGNTVDGNVQVVANKGPAAKTVTGNIIQGAVQCFENDDPFVGSPNAAGQADGQCS